MRDEKIATFIEMHEDVVVSMHSEEVDLDLPKVAQQLGIDREPAEKFVQATSMLTRQDELFTLHLIEAITEPELIEVYPSFDFKSIKILSNQAYTQSCWKPLLSTVTRRNFGC